MKRLRILLNCAALLVVAHINQACFAQSMMAPEHNQAPSPSQQQSTITAVPWTPVLLRTALAPQPFRGSEGKVNVIYDVTFQNWDPRPTKLLKLEILDNDGKVLRTFDEHALSQITTQADPAARNMLLLPAGGSAFAKINVEFDNPAQVPDVITHRLTVHADMFGGQRPATLTYEVAPTAIDRRAPVVIGPPLAGGNWLATGGYASQVGHRNALFAVSNRLLCAQCYAIDWVRLDGGNYVARGDLTKNQSSNAYGQPIIAVADGTVIGVIDRFPDQLPGSPAGTDKFDYPEGNAIIEDIGNDLFVLYAHLQPGSIKVKEGQRVKRTQVIAELGNSGNSDGAHLHMQVMDAPHALAASGVPYLFDNFRLVGEITDVQQMVRAAEQGTPQPVSLSPLAGDHHNELPREGAVIVFPDLPPAKPAPPARPTAPAKPTAAKQLPPEPPAK